MSKKDKHKSSGKDSVVTDTFKALLMISAGKSIGNIHPFRLKAAPTYCAGFERMQAHEAKSEGIQIPKGTKCDEYFYVLRFGPAVLKDCIPEWMFLASFEPVVQTDEDIKQ